MSHSKILIKNIRAHRSRLGWTQVELAKKSGLSCNGITKIEQGIAKNPRMETLIKIANAFNVRLDDLVGRKIK